MLNKENESNSAMCTMWEHIRADYNWVVDSNILLIESCDKSCIVNEPRVGIYEVLYKHGNYCTVRTWR